jgi:hypothetical protein
MLISCLRVLGSEERLGPKGASRSQSLSQGREIPKMTVIVAGVNREDVRGELEQKEQRIEKMWPIPWRALCGRRA